MSGVPEESRALLEAFLDSGAEGADDDVRQLGSNLRESLAHYRLMFPELIAYRGGLFIESRFDRLMVDNVIDQHDFDGAEAAIHAAEQFINGVPLLAGDEPFDAGMASAVAASIGWVWRRWIWETYGVAVHVMSSISGPEDCVVWFESAPGDET